MPYICFFQPLITKPTLPDSSKSELTKKEKKKVRHQSSNVFPDGFRVKETVKQRIMGRLRAASHSCDDNGEKMKKSSEGQNVSVVIMRGGKKNKIESYSKTSLEK